ncbi:xanthine dehydrogenase family protein subunit M [Microlunatus spumicola]|uniref:Xanthine dehydrogenase family protein subunit M n=1 Tax=Microlunatus spumicola TaxID=81499 RepID=A0ABP6XSC4_9ACTN
MKPASFAYAAPTSLDEALDALAEDGAVVLAGGQSLVLELVYRDQRPRLVVDVNRVPGLDHLREDDDGLALGALVRHAALERGGDGLVRRLLAEVAPYVAHPPIRARGTFCGSLAWGHPAAEWNAVALALDARVHLRSATGRRTVAGADWFRGDRRTARQDGELVEEVVLPRLPSGATTGFAEHRRTHASFAEVAVVAVVVLEDERVREVRLSAAGLADRPLRLTAVEDLLVGTGAAEVADRARAETPAHLDRAGHHAALAAELAGRALERALRPEVVAA